MEAFQSLNFSPGGEVPAPASASADGRDTSGTTAIVSDDDGPFFDLKFAVPNDEDEGNGSDDNVSNCSENGEDRDELDGGEDEFKFTPSSCSGDNRSVPDLSFSPSDDLFFNGRLVPVEPSEPNNTRSPQFSVSLLKSATKFRVMMLGMKKSKQSAAEKAEPNRPDSPKQRRFRPTTAAEGGEKSFFTVKLKVEEVPIMSIFRDNSTVRTSAKKATAAKKHGGSAAFSEELASSDEKLFSKEVMQKYLKKVKPLYVRVSRRYGDKLRFSGQIRLASGAKSGKNPPATEAQKPVPSPEASEGTAPGNNAKSLKQVNIPAGLRVVCKHLGKSRSASSAAVEAAPPGPAQTKRRDDSLLQQHDGIQSAILHCKRSFNAPRDSELSKEKQSDGDVAWVEDKESRAVLHLETITTKGGKIGSNFPVSLK